MERHTFILNTFIPCQTQIIRVEPWLKNFKQPSLEIKLVGRHRKNSVCFKRPLGSYSSSLGIGTYDNLWQWLSRKLIFSWRFSKIKVDGKVCKTLFSKLIKVKYSLNIWNSRLIPKHYGWNKEEDIFENIRYVVQKHTDQKLVDHYTHLFYFRKVSFILLFRQSVPCSSIYQPTIGQFMTKKPWLRSCHILQIIKNL